MTSQGPHATRVTADGARVTVASSDERITDWVARYFGPWWTATAVPPPSGTCQPDGAVVVADVDPDAVTTMRLRTGGKPRSTFHYAGALTHLTEGDNGLLQVIQPGTGLALSYDPTARRMTIAGSAVGPVSVMAARLTRELVRGQLLHAGYHLLHAAATVRDGQALLALGPKGAGKTTTALLLARHGHQLLSNDRLFVRATADGIRVLPWPAAAAIGLGFLHALGAYGTVRARVLGGEQLHPTQTQEVTDAIRAGRTDALYRPDGRELKAQFFPDQLTTWLSLSLATHAEAAALLLPRIEPGTQPNALQAQRGLGSDDFFTPAADDRYPDLFRLAPNPQNPVGQLIDQLALLPRRTVTLSHDIPSSARLLTAVAAGLLPGPADR